MDLLIGVILGIILLMAQPSPQEQHHGDHTDYSESNQSDHAAGK